ncbi:MAG TPA: LON peptidase substrate-binding domain-containing protein [bacterium]|nr:LON peptidase substrate-binding domain-containing protein [bacterium]
MLLLAVRRIEFPGRRADIPLDDDVTEEALGETLGSADPRVFLALLRDPRERHATSIHDYDVFPVGTIARLLEYGDRAVVEVEERGRIVRITPREDLGFDATVDSLPVNEPALPEIGERMRRVRELFVGWARTHGRVAAESAFARAEQNPSRLAYAIASFGPLDENARQKLLETLDLHDQLELLESALLGAK